MTLRADGITISPSTTSGPPVAGVWYEGTLYTDADGVIWKCMTSGMPGLWEKMADDTLRALASDGLANTPTVVTAGNDITISNCVVNLYDNPDRLGVPNQFTIAGPETYTVPDYMTRYIYANYNGGVPELQVNAASTAINESDVVPIATVCHDGNDLHYRLFAGWANGAIAMHNQRLVRTRGFLRQSGLTLGEKAGRFVTIETGTVWYGILMYPNLAPLATDVDPAYLYYHTGGNWDHAYGNLPYDNEHWDDGTNRQDLTPGNYGVNWIYRLVENGPGNDETFIILGRGDYATVLAAQGEALPPVPANVTGLGMLVGRIIVQKGAGTATIIQNAWDSSTSFAATVNHNDTLNKQGGDGATEFYHLTQTEHDTLTDGFDADALHTHDSKADMVAGATNGHFAGLDAAGNLTDSGAKPADFSGVGFTVPPDVDRTAASAGALATAARSDHKHDIATDTPVATGTANAIGSSVSLARADHVHNTVLAVNHHLTVGTSGNVNFNTIHDAVLAAIAGGATKADPWTITVYPGTYNEPPMTIPAGVLLTTNLHRRRDSVYVTAQNAAQDLFTFTGTCSMAGFSLSGVTDPAKALIRVATPGTLVALYGIRVGNCAYGLYVENGASAVVFECSFLIDGAGQAITQSAFYATGAGTLVEYASCFLSVPAAVLPLYAGNPVQTGITYNNGATGKITGSTLRIAPKNATQVGLLVDGSSTIHVLSTEFLGNYTGILVGSTGASTVVTQGVVFEDNTLNFNISSAAGKIFANQAVDEVKRTVTPGALFTGIVTDQFNEYTSLVGAFQYVWDTTRTMSLQDNLHAASGTGVLRGGAVTDATALGVPKVDVALGSGYVVRTSPYDVGQFDWGDETGLALTPNATNFISYNSNTDTVEATLAPVGTSSIPFAVAVTDATSIRFLHEARNFVEVFPQQIGDYLNATQKVILKSGLGVTAGSTARRIDVASGTYYLVLTEVPYGGASDATFSSFYDVGGSIEIPGLTDIDITNFDNTGSIGGGLDPMTPTWYRSDSVYLTSDGRISIVYGTSEHLTSAEAEALPMNSKPPFIDYSAFPLAQLIVQQGVGITMIIDRRSAIATGSSGAAVGVHAALAGLLADDHPQYLPTTGGRAMSGDLNMGGNDIITVGTVDGVDVSAHAARHAPGAADGLTMGTPVAVLVAAAVDPGAAATFARSDHQHGVAAGIPVTIGTGNAAGSASSVAKSDHVHDHGAQTAGGLHAVVIAGGANGFMSGSDKTKLDNILSNTAPNDVTKFAASAGVATDSARRDHKHDISTGVPVTPTIDATPTEGSATSLARSDHQHGLIAAVPVTIGTANTEGDSTSVARANHVHAHGIQSDGTLHAVATITVPGFMSAPDKIKLDGILSDTVAVNADTAAASAGIATVASRQDHRHHVPTALPVDIGTVNSEGAATTIARSSHVHAHGDQTVGSLHAVAIAAGANGFMSGSDKTKLDNILSATAPVNVTKDTANAGSATDAAKRDHKHDITTAAGGTVAIGDTGDDGSATSLARSDHKHTVTAPSAPSDVDKSLAGTGSSPNFARQDHKHDIATATVLTIGTANSEGAGVNLARANHVHDHGSQSTGSHHAVAIAGGANGFLSGSDKTKLDSVASNAAALTSAAPANVSKSAAVVGSATDAAKADHKHDITTGTPGSTTLGATANEGGAASLARSDHTHGTGTPVAPSDVTRLAAAAGSSSTPAREDHKHDIAVGTPGSVTIAASAAEGSASSLARSDHTHGVGTPAAPADVTKATAATGSSSTPAREDHKHDVSTATPSTIGTANSEGDATSLARSNHVHAHGNQTASSLHAVAVAGGNNGFMSGSDKTKLDDILSATAPVNVTKAAANAGAATDAAKRDHKHDIDTAAPAATGVATASGEGSATSLARSDHSHQSNTAPSNVTKATAVIGTSGEPARADHKHDIDTAAPSTIGTANTEGNATSLARSNHVHDHGSLAGGSLHAVATTSVAGFMSSTDKTILDGLSGGTTTYILAGDFTVTNAGLTDVTGMSFAVTAGKAYRVELWYACSGNNTTGDIAQDLVAAAATFITTSAWGKGTHYNNNGNLTNRAPTAFISDLSAQSNLTVNNGDAVVRTNEFTYEFTCTATTTVKLQIGNASAGAGRTSTIYAGAVMRVTQIKTS